MEPEIPKSKSDMVELVADSLERTGISVDLLLVPSLEGGDLCFSFERKGGGQIAQELLRHANSRITIDIHPQAVSDEKRVAAGVAFRRLFENEVSQHLRRLYEKRDKIFKLLILYNLW